MLHLAPALLGLFVQGIPLAMAAPAAPSINITSPELSLDTRATSPGRWEGLGGKSIGYPNVVSWGKKRKLDVFTLGTDKSCW